MALGLGLLRLDPRAFWSMTIPEFSAATRAILPPSTTLDPPRRADITSLMASFPDHSHQQGYG